MRTEKEIDERLQQLRTEYVATTKNYYAGEEITALLNSQGKTRDDLVDELQTVERNGELVEMDYAEKAKNTAIKHDKKPLKL
jgi:hypothetical protein